MDPDQSAFPAPDYFTAQGKKLYGPKNCEGMSLRDYFAAKALQGWLSRGETIPFATPDAQKTIARACYTIADAMLVIRQEK